MSSDFHSKKSRSCCKKLLAYKDSEVLENSNKFLQKKNKSCLQKFLDSYSLVPLQKTSCFNLYGRSSILYKNNKIKDPRRPSAAQTRAVAKKKTRTHTRTHFLGVC